MSIKNRIYISFFLLVSLFVVNGVVTIVNLNNNKKLSRHISEVVDPSIQAMGDFQDMMIDSKMFSTNWVFLRYSKEDKDALLKLHNSDYPELKSRLKELSSQWKETVGSFDENKFLIDSLNNVCAGFEQLLYSEKHIINSLNNFDDYNNPEKKLEAEELLENIILPKTLVLIKALDYIISSKQFMRDREENNLENNSAQLRNMILFLAVSIILLGIFLSVYMSRIIITPINKIRNIVNDLGKGIIRNIVENKANGDEIGEMIHSVNNLSEKLKATATFAEEVGKRNFSIHYDPLSTEDTLGKALITMRDNIKSTDEILNTRNAELTKSNHELDKFVYSVSHDLRAPLLSMQGIIGITAEETKEEMTGEHMQMLNGSITRLDDFIGEILDYSRNARAELKKDAINFKDMLENITNDLKHIRSEGKPVKIYMDINETGIFYSDKRRLSVVFNNLVSNAIRYYNPKIDTPFVKIKINSNDTFTEIDVEDNGIGISEVNQSKVFEMFYRVSEDSTGSGLGLYIVKETIEKLKGEIKVESQQGVGTRFKLNIPTLFYQ